MRAVELVIFGAIAGGLHVGAFVAWSDLAPAGRTGGQDGTAPVTLQAAPETLAALARTWQAAPAARAEAPDAPALPVAAPVPLPEHAAPSAPLPVAQSPALAAAALPETVTPPSREPQAQRRAAAAPQAPSLPTALAMNPAPPAPRPPEPAAMQPPVPQASPGPAPQIETRPPPPPDSAAPVRAARPKTRPARPEAWAEAPAPAAAAAGASNTARTQTGQSPDAASAQPAAGTLRRLEAQWGAAIQAKVQRSARSPGTGPASVRLRLDVAPDGRVLAVRVTQGSGQPKADAAALAAVKRARRFAAAPEGLQKASYAFQVTLRFQ